MKTGWEEKTLGEVCIVERGSSPRPIERYVTTDGSGVNWIKIGDTKGVNKYLYKTKEKITQDGAKQSRYVKEGDFILSNSMSFGNPFVMKTSGYIHDGWFVLRLPDYIETDYFYYLLISPNVRQQFDTLANGAIVKNIRTCLKMFKYSIHVGQIHKRFVRISATFIVFTQPPRPIHPRKSTLYFPTHRNHLKAS